MAGAKICAIEGCGKRATSKGWCQAHYSRWLRNGDPLGGKYKRSACSVDGCRRPHLTRGYCNAHYIRWKKYGSPRVGRDRTDNSGPCAVDGCKRKASVRQMCRIHAYRDRRYGDPLGGASYFHGDQAAWVQRLLSTQHDECVLWPFPVGRNGYGLTTLKGGKGAHRVVCVLAHGEPPTAEHEAAHSCNVRSCVNPRHIRWATRSENMADKTAHGTQLLGERNPQARLTNDEAREVLAMADSAPLREVASRYDVSISTVHNIWRGRTWRWLRDPSPE